MGIPSQVQHRSAWWEDPPCKVSSGLAKTARYLNPGNAKHHLSSKMGTNEVGFGMGYHPVPAITLICFQHPKKKKNSHGPQEPAKLCGEEAPATEERAFFFLPRPPGSVTHRSRASILFFTLLLSPVLLCFS